jgi:CheY-like chemotaxis protein
MKLNNDDVSSGHGAGAFRVLVIDNDDADRELTILHLGEAWPFEHEMVPDHARTGHEALDKMRATRYALAVLDWRLPGMDGGEVLRIMRRERILTPVIVVSGLGNAPRTHPGKPRASRRGISEQRQDGLCRAPRRDCHRPS